MIKILRAKFHDIKVTGSALDYHGSITLDPEQCEAAGIYPLEFVEIWNKCSGCRITTYVIYGERGSKCCILNGAAARTCQVGDGLIICASEFVDSPACILKKKPVVLCFDSDNTILEILKYDINEDENGRLKFNIVKYS